VRDQPPVTELAERVEIVATMSRTDVGVGMLCAHYSAALNGCLASKSSRTV
jgi:hypothetical protein